MEETPKALRVALVEDDPRIQQLICAEITDEGHYCTSFGSAEDFLNAAGSDNFDLVLLDLMLPGMDGLTCLKQLQLKAASGPAQRVVIVTALNDDDKRREALERVVVMCCLGMEMDHRCSCCVGGRSS